jgi:RNA polymerase sigma factor (sigma-70 family)
MARYKPTEIPYYEGLIRTTAAMCAPRVEVEYEDIVSIFRIKVWRALEAFDPTRSRMPVERYVFSCVKNQEKDLLKRKRRGELYIEDVRGPGEGGQDAFEEAYLAAEDDYAGVERELPVIPSTLSQLERQVIVRLYSGLTQRETAFAMLLTRSEMERTMRDIRTKMADWRPSAPERALEVA